MNERARTTTNIRGSTASTYNYQRSSDEQFEIQAFRKAGDEGFINAHDDAAFKIERSDTCKRRTGGKLSKDSKAREAAILPSAIHGQRHPNQPNQCAKARQVCKRVS